MKTILKTLKTKTTNLAGGLWCYRTAYAGLAIIYSAGCFGLVDKDSVAQVATLIHAMMTVLRH